jgi:hypothetical protein
MAELLDEPRHGTALAPATGSIARQAFARSSPADRFRAIVGPVAGGCRSQESRGLRRSVMSRARHLAVIEAQRADRVAPDRDRIHAERQAPPALRAGVDDD